MLKFDVPAVFRDKGVLVTKTTHIPTLANTVQKVETDQGIFYFKLFDDATSATSRKLASVYPTLHEKGVPVPKVLAFGDDYIILSEATGTTLADIKMTDEQMIACYEDFGRTVAKIHSITFSLFGETMDGRAVVQTTEQEAYADWKSMHKQIIHERLSLFDNSSFADLKEPIAEWFKQRSDLIDYVIVPRLLHTDLNKKNVFAHNGMMSCIIDFDDAFVGHNEEELMRIEGAHFSDNETLREAFFQGYTELISLDAGYAERRTYYYLSRLLVHIGCIIEFGSTYTDVQKEVPLLRQEVKAILNNEEISFTRNKLVDS